MNYFYAWIWGTIFFTGIDLTISFYNPKKKFSFKSFPYNSLWPVLVAIGIISIFVIIIRKTLEIVSAILLMIADLLAAFIRPIKKFFP